MHFDCAVAVVLRCNYNIVLNEATNNSDVMHIANIVLNEDPNSNDTV